jgi:hypothetical protein
MPSPVVGKVMLLVSIYPLFPAKAGIQIHSQTPADLTWIPAFAGMSGFEGVR